MQKCYQIYKLMSLVRYRIITFICVCMNKELLQNEVVNTPSHKPSSSLLAFEIYFSHLSVMSFPSKSKYSLLYLTLDNTVEFEFSNNN